MPDNMLSEVDDSWAAQVEAEHHLPPREVKIKDNIKTVIEYKFNEQDQKVKITSKYRIEKKRVPRVVATRRKLKKFGDSAHDAEGPSPHTTFLSEIIDMQFIRNTAGELLELKQEDQMLADEAKKDANRQTCKYCKALDHFSFACPYKSIYEESRNLLEGEPSEGEEPGTRDREQALAEKAAAGKYVAPSVKARASGSSMNDRRDDFTVRVTNLPEDTTDNDLRDLFKSAGNVQRIFLAKDKTTQKSKGFAFVTYGSREDAEKAINTVSGHRYDHLILKVEWARANT